MKIQNPIAAALSAAGLALSAPVSAAVFEVADQYQVLPVEFSGTITSSVSDRIILSRPDGTFFEYEGVRPDFPFDTGDTITIGFDAIVPTGAAIAGGIVPPSADGIYRFGIGTGSGNTAGDSSTISFRNFQGTDIADTGNYISNGQLGIVYDANADSYLIDPPTDKSFALGVFDAPVLRYDIDSGVLTSALFSDLFPQVNGGLTWTGSAATGGQIGSDVFTFDNGQFVGGPAGIIRFSGGWNLPIFGQGPVPVSAPGMLIIFGLGAAAVWRRKSLTVEPN